MIDWLIQSYIYYMNPYYIDYVTYHMLYINIHILIYLTYNMYEYMTSLEKVFSIILVKFLMCKQLLQKHMKSEQFVDLILHMLWATLF